MGNSSNKVKFYILGTNSSTKGQHDMIFSMGKMKGHKARDFN